MEKKKTLGAGFANRLKMGLRNVALSEGQDKKHAWCSWYEEPRVPTNHVWVRRG